MDKQAKADFNRRSFLTTGAAGVGAVAMAGAATEANAQAINWDQTADVVIIGAGVAGLARRHHRARARRLGDRRRGELRHRRPRHAERRARAARRRPRAAAEVQHQGHRRPGVPRLGARRRRREPLQRPRSGARLRRRERLDLPVPARQRRRVHREADRPGRRLDRCRASSSPRNGTSRPRWWRRTATATARGSCGGSPKARARRARRSCSSTR